MTNRKIAASSLAALLLTSPWTFAGTGILANTDTFKPQVSLTENFSEKLVRFFTLEPDPENPGDPFTDENENGKWDAGEPFENETGGPGYDGPKFIKVFSYGKIPSQRVTARIVANLKGVAEDAENPEAAPVDFDFDTINEETEVSVTVGDYTFSSTLGAEESRGVFSKRTVLKGVAYEAGDPKPLGSSALYKLGYSYPKLTSAGEEMMDEEGNPIILFKQTGTIRIEWNSQAKTVTFTVEQRTQAPDIAEPAAKPSIAASRLAGLSNRASRSFANQPVPVSVTFGSCTGTRIAYARGLIKSKYHRVLARQEEEDPYVRSVGIVAAADNEGPRLRMTVPAAADPEVFGVDFLGTVTDRPAPTFANVFEVASRELAPPTVELLINGEGDPDGGAYPVDFTDAQGNPLPTDDEGNPTIPGYVNGLGYIGGFCELYEVNNLLTFIARDAEGNVSLFTRKVTAKALEEIERSVTQRAD